MQLHTSQSPRPRQPAPTKGFSTARICSSIHVPFRLSNKSTRQGLISFRQPLDFQRDHYRNVMQGPLLKRARVVQERLFSRRTIDFSTKRIYWELTRDCSG